MSPRAARLGLALFTGLVAASFGVALAGLTWRLLGDPGRRYGAVPVVAAAPPPVDVGPLIARAPFGTGGGATPATPSASDLVLRGILLATPRDASVAIVQAAGAPPVAVGVGQAIGGASVEAIERDRVVLLAGGARQVLAFPQPPGGTAPTAAPAMPTPAPPAPPAGLLQSLGGTLTADGFRIGPAPGPAAAVAGLQPGDVLQRINGVAVADLLANPAALSAMAAAGSARVEVVRGGGRLTLAIPLR